MKGTRVKRVHPVSKDSLSIGMVQHEIYTVRTVVLLRGEYYISLEELDPDYFALLVAFERC